MNSPVVMGAFTTEKKMLGLATIAVDEGLAFRFRKGWDSLFYALRVPLILAGSASFPGQPENFS